MPGELLGFLQTEGVWFNSSHSYRLDKLARKMRAGRSKTQFPTFMCLASRKYDAGLGRVFLLQIIWSRKPLQNTQQLMLELIADAVNLKSWRALSDSTELKLQMVVSHYACAMDWTHVLCKKANALNYSTISPAPPLRKVWHYVSVVISCALHSLL